MQQDGTFGNPGGAAGVLQHRYFVSMYRWLRKWRCRANRNGRIKAYRVRQVKRRNQLLHVAHHVIHQTAFKPTELIAHGAQHHMLDRRGFQAFL